MPRVVPSQVVRMIDDRFFSVYGGGVPPSGQLALFYSDHAADLRTLLDLVQEIPEQLLTLDSEQYNAFSRGRSAIESILRQWFEQNDHRPLRVRGEDEVHPLILVYEALKQCPDQASAQGTSELLFIPDPETRECLRLDISSAKTALVNGEWKAATVLAGSVVEALLLWGLRQRSEAELSRAEGALSSSLHAIRPRGMRSATITDLLEHQSLSWFIRVARELGVIDSQAASLADVVREFRNLIHPGNVTRRGRQCSQGTAHGALAALHIVIEEFERRTAVGLPI